MQKRIAWNKGKKKFPITQCLQCGRDFFPKMRSRTKTPTVCCSNECANKLKYNKHSIYFECKNCGKEQRTTQAHIKLSKGYCSKKCVYESEEWKEKQRKAVTGEKSPTWKGGITKKSLLIRTSSAYKEWRKKVFERDNYTCVLCGAKSKKGKIVILNADHIKPFATNSKHRLEISNGRTLCLPCHKETPTYLNKGRQLLKNSV